MPLEPRELIQLAAMELRQASSPYLNLELTAESAMAFLGMMQLVLSHPDLPEAMADLARQISETIECQLSACGPAVRELCRRSWDPSSDESVN